MEPSPPSCIVTAFGGALQTLQSMGRAVLACCREPACRVDALATTGSAVWLVCARLYCQGVKRLADRRYTQTAYAWWCFRGRKTLRTCSSGNAGNWRRIRSRRSLLRNSHQPRHKSPPQEETAPQQKTRARSMVCLAAGYGRKSLSRPGRRLGPAHSTF